MTQSIIDIGDAPNDGTGDPVRDAFNKCNNNFTELYAADSVVPAGTATPPQGRLTLQTATPVMTTTQAAKTTILYSPYCGDKIGLFDGTSFVMTTFVELSAAITDTTKSPAAIGASKVNDWFVWSDAGTIRLGHGPDWTNDTTRSAGTALVMVNGIWLNNVSITNGPVAQRGTYVGTTRSNASSQLDWIYGVPGVGAAMVPSQFLVWNCYNRVEIIGFVAEDTSNWTYAGAGVWRAANAQNNYRHNAVFGLSEDAMEVMYLGLAQCATGSSAISVALDVTNAPGTVWFDAINLQYTQGGIKMIAPLGFHYFQAVEYSVTASATFFSKTVAPNHTRAGMFFSAKM